MCRSYYSVQDKNFEGLDLLYQNIPENSAAAIAQSIDLAIIALQNTSEISPPHIIITRQKCNDSKNGHHALNSTLAPFFRNTTSATVVQFRTDTSPHLKKQ